MVWQDKKPFFFLSTHAKHVRAEGEKQIVLIKSKNDRVQVQLGPMYIQYQTNMRGVDNADQISGRYDALTKSHKWWHQIFNFQLDTTVVNPWITHCNLSFRFLQNTLSHLEFHMQIAKALASTWRERSLGFSKFANDFPRAHMTWCMENKRHGPCL